MSTRVAITHRIEQHFARQVRLPTHWLRLRPAPEQRAQIAAFSLAVHAEPHFLNWVRDPFENHLGRLDFPEPIAGFGITLELIAELEPTNPFDFLAEPYAAEHPFEYPDQLKKELSPYLLDRGAGAALERLAREGRSHEHDDGRAPGCPQPNGSRSARPHDRGSSARGGSGEVSRAGEGSCWDFAWLLTVTLRHLGLAARFACGYRVLLCRRAAQRLAATLPGHGDLAHLERGVHSGRRLGRARPFHGDLRHREPYPARVRSGAAARASDCGRWRGAPGDAERKLARAAFDAVARELAAYRYPVGGYRSAGPLPRQGPGAPGAEASGRGEPVVGLGPGRRRARVEHASHRSVEALAGRVAVDLAVEAAGARWGASARTRGVVRRRVSPALAARLLLPRGRQARVEKSRAPQLRASAGHPFARLRHNGCCSRSRAGWGSIRHAWSRRTRTRFTSSGAPAPPRPPTSRAPEDLRDPVRRRALAERLSSAHRAPTGYVLPLSWDHTRACWVSGAWRFRRSELYLAPGSASMGYRLPLDGLIDDEAGVLEASNRALSFRSAWKPPRFPRRRARA